MKKFVGTMAMICLLAVVVGCQQQRTVEKPAGPDSSSDPGAVVGSLGNEKVADPSAAAPAK